MKNHDHSRTRRLLLLVLPVGVTAWFAGCGGGEENYETVDLSAAYEAITKGMSYIHIRNIVGLDPISTTANGTTTLLYRWEAGRNTYLYSTLIIEIDNMLGVVTKSVTGPDGNKTESYTASSGEASTPE